MSEKKVKMHVLGWKDKYEEIYEERKYLANAGNVFRSKSLDRCHITFDVESKQDVDKAIEVLKAVKPCFNQNQNGAKNE